MSSIKNVELSHRPNNREKYSIIIPCAGMGKRMKTYGPKSLTPIGNGTILSHQLKLIYECFNYNEIILVGGYEIEKLKKHVDDRVKLVNNKDYQDTNVLHSIGLGINKAKTDKIVIIYGDLVFNKSCIYLPFHNESGIVVAQSIKEEEVGCIYRGNLLESLFFGLPNKWAQISYFTGRELDLLRTIANTKPDWFGFEAINEIITLGGIFKVFLPKNGQSTDIDSAYDLKKFNEHINKTEFVTS